MDHDYAAAQHPDEPYAGVQARRTGHVNVAVIVENEDIFVDLEQSDEETQQPPDDEPLVVEPESQNGDAEARNNIPLDLDERPGPSTSSQATVATPPVTSFATTLAALTQQTTGERHGTPTSGTTTTVTTATVTTVSGEALPNINYPDCITNPVVTPSPGRKRKRLSLVSSRSGTPKCKASTNVDDAEDDDEGLICPICLDSWELSGEHRLVSLRCGHLFGDICIRRWLNESARQSGIKLCPQCKTKSSNKDIRYLYARRIRALDRSEEDNLKELFKEERKRSQNLQIELASLKMTNALNKNRIEALEQDNDRMKRLLRSGTALFGYGADSNANIIQQLQQHKLFLERNIDISREPGCRVMTYAEQHTAVLVSQKSGQILFPGFGVRFIDTETFRTSQFMHVSLKLLRDMCLSSDQQSLVVTSMETRAKLFDLRMRQFSTQFMPGSIPLWSCAMDRNDRDQLLYLGGQHGGTYVYDIRHPETILNEYSSPEDTSPIIQMAVVSSNKIFANGGFLVCSLRSLYFYEYVGNTATPTRLNIEGPFVSMSYSLLTETILISTRCSPNFPQSRYIIAALEKINDMVVLNVKVSFFGSKSTPVMTRPSQIAVEANTLVAGYVQDVKLLSLYDVRREARMQSVPVQETVFDTCPIYTAHDSYLAALTETKCRIYKVSTIN